MDVILTVGTVSIPLASPEQVLGDFIFNVSVVNGDVSSLYQRIDSATPETTLSSVPPGSYSATAQRFDTSGNAFGGIVTATFSVSELIPVSLPPVPDDPTDPTQPVVDPNAPVVAMGLAAGTMTVTLQ